jgi:site-specific DNA-adenine methylase
MPSITYEEFEQDYLRIIAKIALKAAQKKDVKITEDINPILLDFNAKNKDDYQEEIEELRLLKEQAEKAEFKDELGDFNFSLNNRLLDHNVDEAVFRFFVQDILM